jgi:hypothetical protein
VRRRKRVVAIVSFTNDEVMAAMQDKFNERFLASGVKTGILFLEMDMSNETVSFVQYEGDVK